MKELKSELFNNSYCIFIDKQIKQTFKPIVEKYKNEGVRILEGNFENSPTCIVIPNVLNFYNLEKKLFELKPTNSGFWGQMGIGYSNKTWKEI